MKKLLLVGATLLITGLYAGDTKEKNTAKCALCVKDEANTRVCAGCSIEVVLDSNPTTGYQWTKKESPEGIVNISQQYVPNEKNQALVGIGGHEHFTITALKSGATTLTFSYKRSWEKDPIKTKTLIVTVCNEEKK